MNPQKAKQVKIYGIASLVLYALCIVCCCAKQPAHTFSHAHAPLFFPNTLPTKATHEQKFKTKHLLAVLA